VSRSKIRDAGQIRRSLRQVTAISSSSLQRGRASFWCFQQESRSNVHARVGTRRVQLFEELSVEVVRRSRVKDGMFVEFLGIEGNLGRLRQLGIDPKRA
jgi:hypothetical protein